MSKQDSHPDEDRPVPSPEWTDDENLPPLLPQMIVPRPNFVARKPRATDNEEDPAATEATGPGIGPDANPAGESAKVHRDDPRPERVLAPSNPVDELSSDRLPAATPLADPPAPPQPAQDAPAPEEEAAAVVVADEQPAASWINPTEKRWLTILAVGLVLAGGILAYLMRDSLPTDSRYVATLSPELPIKGSKITINSIQTSWRQLGTQADVKTREGLRITPEVAFTFSPDSNGALRIFFRNERDQQAGDTINLEIRDGRVTGANNSQAVSCTKGLRTLLEYNDLAASGNTYWAIEIHEGSDPRGPMSDYTLLAKLRVPWNLSPHSSNER